MPLTRCRRAFNPIFANARRSRIHFTTLQTPITRMKLRVEMADQPELRDKLLNDLDNMTRLVREGIAYARSSESLEETSLKLELNARVNSIACDYQDIGKTCSFRQMTPACR